MRYEKKFITALTVLIICFLFTLCVGRYHIDIKSLFRIINLKITNKPVPQNLYAAYTVLWSVRLPRALLSLIVGISLTLSGTVFQGLFKNPLVSPDILGVSSGASFGAACAILFFGNSPFYVQIFTFIFGLLAVYIASFLSKLSRNNSTTNLVLSGIIVSSLFSAGLSFLKYIADPYEELPAIIFWTMGSFNTASWQSFITALIITLPGLIIIFIFRWRLNVLTLEDDEALSLGVDIKKARKVYIFAATLIVAASISSCGIISWVGLVVPHMAQMIVGPDHKKLIPFCAVLGGSFMIIMDTLSRTMSAGEIPISIITSFLGAPFFAFLLIRQGRNMWNE